MRVKDKNAGKPLQAQPPTEAEMGHLNRISMERGPESWVLFDIRKGDLRVFLSVLLWGGGKLPKSAGRGVPFPRSQSSSRPVSVPFCARSALY